MNILDYTPGMVVTETCIVRGVPMAVYHTQAICSAPSISSSGIRTIESRSLSHFYEDSEFNPNRPEQEPKTYFSWGKALHHLAGGEAGFAKFFAVRPTTWDSWRTKDSQAWKALQTLEGRDVLVPADLATLRMAADRLHAHPTIQAGILHGLVEHSVFVKCEVPLPDGRVVTIFLKARPDVIPTDSNMIVDLKSTADASPVAVRRSTADYGYHIQLALAQFALHAATGRLSTEHVLVFIESKPPCEINIKPLSALAIEYGRRQMTRAIQKFALAVTDNCWPGYEDDEVEISLPVWMQTRLEKEAEDGRLPGLDLNEWLAPASEAI